MKFWLGTDRAHWLSRAGVPLFVSARVLRPRKAFPRASRAWALDSGAFSELNIHGRWTIPPRQYAAEVRRWRDEIGNLAWAAPQDWMCEPFMLAKTGLSAAYHQKLTTENYLRLREIAPDLPWIPVLQGWDVDDYLRHVDDYGRAGIGLAALPLVGLGSVCRRQGTTEVEGVVAVLARWRGLRLHAFGLKTLGMRRCADLLASSDSMAWSYRARRSPPLPGCDHRRCNHCLRYALGWRARLLRESE